MMWDITRKYRSIPLRMKCLHGMDRDIDDLEKALAELAEIDATKVDLDKVLKGLDEALLNMLM